MKPLVVAGLLGLAACSGRAAKDSDQARWEARADAVTITRDDWGVPHVRGKSDADAVFGLIYAQAEDDFNRVEMNYLNAMGRTAEALGESAIWADLRMRLIADPDSMRAQYARSPEWLRALMNAWADGLNYFLATHPEVKPKVLTRFEPWMVLSFTEGSIGWDIESVGLTDIEAFYGGTAPKTVALEPGFREPTGSNGIAIGPAMTQSGDAMLLINPHTSFFFREEAQVTSDEGLNAYGAITWGQFFVYQGFNERAGWMHTSSGADAIDEYALTIARKPEGVFYRYGDEERPLSAAPLTLRYRTPGGAAERRFTTYRSHHGPIVREQAGKWIAVRLMNSPIDALTQSYLRTKVAGYDDFKRNMDRHTNSSNNTVYADRDGTIAYFHANFVPRRDPKFDWTRPVDGSDPATEWQGIHPVDESPNVKNPANGWIQNTNNWPYSAAGAANSPRAKDYPAYFDRYGENARGIHAIRVLEGRRGFTLDSLIAAAYDPALPAFDQLLPSLFEAWDRTGATADRTRLAEPIAALRSWDRKWSVTSVPTSLAVYWALALWELSRGGAEAEAMSAFDYMARRTDPATRVQALRAAVDKLAADFGTWKTPWGEINRFQRLTGDIVQQFTDSGPSTPVGFTSGQWGSLASFGARTYPGTKRMYGTGGNSFVAVVEFGKDGVKARAVTAGGLASDPRSKHFDDQAERYATGRLRDVYFYPRDLQGHVEREYHPGRRD
jgi:acyl-homoserine-lactone acylase